MSLLANSQAWISWGTSSPQQNAPKGHYASELGPPNGLAASALALLEQRASKQEESEAWPAQLWPRHGTNPARTRWAIPAQSSPNFQTQKLEQVHDYFKLLQFGEIHHATVEKWYKDPHANQGNLFNVKIISTHHFVHSRATWKKVAGSSDGSTNILLYHLFLYLRKM